MPSKYHKNSVRYRLTLWNITLISLILFSFILILNFTIRSILITDIDQRLEFVSSQYYTFILERLVPRTTIVTDPSGQKQIIITNKLGYHEPSPLPLHFNLSGRMPLRKRVYIRGIYYSPSGDILHSQDANPNTVIPLEPNSFNEARSGQELYTYAFHQDRKYRVLYQPVIVDDTLLGIIQSAMPVDEFETLMEKINLILISFIPLALVIAGASGLILTQRMLQPVRNMAIAADNITATDLSKRLPLSGYDEFTQLGGTINHMLGRLENSFDALTEAFNREQRFTQDASHELRTPLTAIKANASLALRNNRSNDYYKKTLLEIEKSADYMTAMIQDLLLMARSESKTMSLKIVEINCRRLFEEVLNSIEQLREKRSVRIELPQEDLLFNGDFHQLKRLLINLMENALRHTPIDGLILLKGSKNIDRLILSVEDNGEGIGKEHIPYLTRRFYRVDKSRNKKLGGTGLGLAISKSIAELHNGKLEIESELGKGTIVSINLPLTDKNAEEREKLEK